VEGVANPVQFLGSTKYVCTFIKLPPLMTQQVMYQIVFNKKTGILLKDLDLRREMDRKNLE